MTHQFKIRAGKLQRETDSGYFFGSYKGTNKHKFSIPKSQTIKFEPIKITNPYTKEDEDWIEMTVTDWIWNTGNIEKKLKHYKNISDVIINGETHFGINWDFVIVKRRNINHCFFCHGKIRGAIKTKDHLIPGAVLRAYGLKGGLPNNTVPCCIGCNREKANLHPEVYKKLVQRKIGETGNPKYRVIMFTLDNILKT